MRTGSGRVPGEIAFAIRFDTAKVLLDRVAARH